MKANIFFVVVVVVVVVVVLLFLFCFVVGLSRGMEKWREETVITPDKIKIRKRKIIVKNIIVFEHIKNLNFPPSSFSFDKTQWKLEL